MVQNTNMQFCYILKSGDTGDDEDDEVMTNQ